MGAELKARVDNLESSDHDQWDAINAIKNRLPLWATFMFSGLGAALATAITVIITFWAKP